MTSNPSDSNQNSQAAETNMESSETSTEYNRSEALRRAILRLKESRNSDSEKVTTVQDDALPISQKKVDVKPEVLSQSTVAPPTQIPMSPKANVMSDATPNDITLSSKTSTQQMNQVSETVVQAESSPTKDGEIVPASISAVSNYSNKPTDKTPWTLQQFFDGEIDLDIELSKRFPNMPLMSKIKFRTLGAKSGRQVATLTSADGSASIIVDADTTTKAIQVSFTYGSMMTLRYSLDTMSAMDRNRWIELMRRKEGGVAFLWGATRWQEDYMICVARKYATNLYAFSPQSFESAIRLTTPTTQALIDWLDEIWQAEPEEPDDSDAPLLTW